MMSQSYVGEWWMGSSAVYLGSGSWSVSNCSVLFLQFTFDVFYLNLNFSSNSKYTYFYSSMWS